MDFGTSSFEAKLVNQAVGEQHDVLVHAILGFKSGDGIRMRLAKMFKEGKCLGLALGLSKLKSGKKMSKKLEEL